MLPDRWGSSAKLSKDWYSDQTQGCKKELTEYVHVLLMETELYNFRIS
jgi:hypothetical protein